MIPHLKFKQLMILDYFCKSMGWSPVELNHKYHMPFSCTDCDLARNLNIVKDYPIMNGFTINYILQLSPSLNNVTHKSTYCEYLTIKPLSTKMNQYDYCKYKHLHPANVFCAIFICYYIKVVNINLICAYTVLLVQDPGGVPPPPP